MAESLTGRVRELERKAPVPSCSHEALPAILFDCEPDFERELKKWNKIKKACQNCKGWTFVVMRFGVIPGATDG